MWGDAHIHFLLLSHLPEVVPGKGWLSPRIVYICSLHCMRVISLWPYLKWALICLSLQSPPRYLFHVFHFSVTVLIEHLNRKKTEFLHNLLFIVLNPVGMRICEYWKQRVETVFYKYLLLGVQNPFSPSVKDMCADISELSVNWIIFPSAP